MPIRPLFAWIIALAWPVTFCTHALGDAPAAPTFNSARYMRLAEVRVGMTGHGLSVFKGTKVERFEVEVLSVLRNFNPGHDVILVRCAGANLEHTGSIAGMSGSPIYLRDEKGRERMVGAFAYGWPLMKDPVGGVQPIEYMLEVGERRDEGGEKQRDEGTAARRDEGGEGREVLASAVRFPSSTFHYSPSRFEYPPEVQARMGGADEDATRLRPLGTPLMAAGVSGQWLAGFAPMLGAQGLIALQAGTGVAAAATTNNAAAEAPPFVPGGVLAVPLLTGDIEMSAIGTVTDVIGDRVIGFGHPFNNEGPVSLPMGTGQINTVIANLTTSFKLGSLTQIRGTLLSDQLVGVSGRIGAAPAMIPMEFTVRYEDSKSPRTLRCKAALHPRLTPLIAALALGSSLSTPRELPQYHTLEYELNLEFTDGRTVRVSNTMVNASPAELFYEIGNPMLAAAENPFAQVLVRKVSGEIRVIPRARQATVVSVNLARLKYRPGETIKADVVYRPFRGDESILPIEVPLPRDLPDGTYQFSVNDWRRHLEQEHSARPFRFNAESIDEVFAVVRDIGGVRRDALYVRLMRQPDGVAIGRVAMPQLPSSMRQVLLNAGRSDTTAFVSSTVTIIPTHYVMDATAQFTITIDRNARVETGHRPGDAEPAPPRANEPSRPNPGAAHERPQAQPKDKGTHDEP